MENLAPPHARGWTGLHSSLTIHVHGSPARAGMDLLFSWGSQTLDGLPRTRGDGPGRDAVRAADTQAPPHARGWTWRLVCLPTVHPGSPARAGMDPVPASTTAARTGLPRTRGDGPGGGCGPAEANEAPPHARGWTVDLTRIHHFVVGSPARAGMDRCGSGCLPMAGRLPRTRGDGPPMLIQAAVNLLAPPHARGWTANTLHQVFTWLGSPARAGMDPYQGTFPPASAWLPRTRGDGPGSEPPHGLRRKAPPHARGWTPG